MAHPIWDNQGRCGTPMACWPWKRDMPARRGTPSDDHVATSNPTVAGSNPAGGATLTRANIGNQTLAAARKSARPTCIQHAAGRAAMGELRDVGHVRQRCLSVERPVDVNASVSWVEPVRRRARAADRAARVPRSAARVEKAARTTRGVGGQRVSSVVEGFLVWFRHVPTGGAGSWCGDDAVRVARVGVRGVLRQRPRRRPARSRVSGGAARPPLLARGVMRCAVDLIASIAD